MASKENLPLHEKYERAVSRSADEKERRLKEERENLQDNVSQIAKGALSDSSDYNARAPQEFIVQQTLPTLKSRPQRATPEVTSAVLSPKTPVSPETSNYSDEKIVASSLPRINTIDEFADLKTSLSHRESQIQRLKKELNDAQNEVKRMRTERDEAERKSVDAILNDEDKLLEVSKKREKQLVDMIRDKKQEIIGLEDRLDKARELHRKLQAKLAEAERSQNEQEGSRAESRPEKSRTKEQKVEHATKRFKETLKLHRRITSKTETPLQTEYYLSKGNKRRDVTA